MPTYDYRCERTGEMFEYRQSFSDDALTACPLTHAKATKKCGGPVKKVFSKVGISFKGEGFYKTDHGTKKPSPANESSSDSGAKTDSSSTTAATKSTTPATPKKDEKGSSASTPSD